MQLKGPLFSSCWFPWRCLRFCYFFVCLFHSSWIFPSLLWDDHSVATAMPGAFSWEFTLNLPQILSLLFWSRGTKLLGPRVGVSVLRTLAAIFECGTSDSLGIFFNRTCEEILGSRLDTASLMALQWWVEASKACYKQNCLVLGKKLQLAVERPICIIFKSKKKKCL